MISVGIFNGYYPYTLEETIKRIKDDGFTCVQLDLSFKDMDLEDPHTLPEKLTVEKAHKIRNAFRDANIQIVAISGYTNLVSPDPVKREKNIAYVKTLLKFARDLGSPYVISETGTYDTSSDWVYHEKNSTEEAVQEITEVIRDLAEYAHKHDAVFLVENYVNNIVGSVDQVLRLFREVDHPGLGLLLDPTNFFTGKNIDDVDNELYRIFNALEDKVKIAHAKDIKYSEDKSEKHAAIDAVESHTFRGAGDVELPAAGLGALNYDLYLELLSKKHPNIPIIIEHLDEEDIPRAKKFLDDKLKKIGV
ncbi:sugar phosphate isomerase/epimerase [Neobacillus notoginsengisoli]|uniref:Sugar phosphate isomerase/epimerase n=1 Tax=Neobacillus notoginsengisoli TaxID=1578198 RepID=A0A417YW47_9BACI|nr:sugar phosphate isomerase/epimerase [Neobacillus notoginsengisoli]RHW41639.1 sugar phosphate isomerase/epimerase [Neobacillus notoginsengisoli]